MKLMLPALGAVAASFAIAGSASAQLGDVILINDSFDGTTMEANDQLLRLDDLNGDDDYVGQLETNLLFEFEPGPVLNGYWIKNVRVREENGAAAVYFVNNADPNGFVPQLFRGEDLDNSGRIEAAEAVELYNFDSVVGSTQGAEGLALTPDGGVWTSADFPGGAIIRRLNGVNTVFIDNDGAGPYTATDQNGSPATVDTDDFNRMTSVGDGVAVFVDGFSEDRTEAVWAFNDFNGNDAWDLDELRPFLTPTDINPYWAPNPDFGNSLRSFEIPNPADTGPGDNEPPFFVGRFEHLATQMEQGSEVYYFATASSNSSQFSTNVNGEGLNGLIYRGIDGNGDGDVNDAGEVELYFDGSITGPSTLPIDKILGIDAYDGSIYVFGLFGVPGVAVLTDNNGDGDALDSGEQIAQAWEEGLFPNCEPWDLFLFGTGMAAFDPDLLAEALTQQAELSGFPCSQTGLLPQIGASGDIEVGSSSGDIRLTNALPGEASILFVGTSSTVWQGLPLPLDIGPFGFPGCELYQNLAVSFFQINDANGEAHVPAQIPANPAFAGVVLPMQWFTTELDIPGQTIRSGLSELMSITVK